MTSKKRLERLEQAARQETVQADDDALLKKAFDLPDDHPIKVELIKRMNAALQHSVKSA